MQYDTQEHTSLRSLTCQQQQFGGGGGGGGPSSYQKKLDKQSQKNQEEALKLQREMLTAQIAASEQSKAQSDAILAQSAAQLQEQRRQFNQNLKLQMDLAKRVTPATPTNYGAQRRGNMIANLERRRNSRGLSTTLRAGNTGRVNTAKRTLTEA